MADLPAVNSLLQVAVSDELTFPSRVEDVDGQLLTIAAPTGRGDIDIPAEDHELELYWTGARTRYMVHGRMVGRTKDQPPRWHILAITEPIRQTRRRFVRGGGGGSVRIHPAQATDDDGTSRPEEIAEVDWFDGWLIDISEAGLRCRLRGADFASDEPVVVGISLAGTSLRLVGTVLSVQPDDRQEYVDVVVTYELPERDARVIRQHVLQWEISQRGRQVGVGRRPVAA